MTISISIPSQPSTLQTAPKVNLRLAGDTDSSSSSSTAVASTNQANSLLQVNSKGKIESPFIQVNKQSSEIQNTSAPKAPSASPVDKTPQQLRSLSQQQSNIREQQSVLEKQEVEINRELNLLQQKEVEINRKRFQLQQKSVGNLLNLKI